MQRFFYQSEFEVDLIQRMKTDLLATAYDHLSWSKGFVSQFFTWSVDNEKSWSAQERDMKGDTEKLCIIRGPEFALWGPTSTMENYL